MKNKVWKCVLRSFKDLLKECRNQSKIKFAIFRQFLILEFHIEPTSRRPIVKKNLFKGHFWHQYWINKPSPYRGNSSMFRKRLKFELYVRSGHVIGQKFDFHRFSWKVEIRWKPRYWFFEPFWNIRNRKYNFPSEKMPLDLWFQLTHEFIEHLKIWGPRPPVYPLPDGQSYWNFAGSQLASKDIRWNDYKYWFPWCRKCLQF